VRKLVTSNVASEKTVTAYIRSENHTAYVGSIKTVTTNVWSEKTVTAYVGSEKPYYKRLEYENCHWAYA